MWYVNLRNSRKSELHSGSSKPDTLNRMGDFTQQCLPLIAVLYEIVTASRRILSPYRRPGQSMQGMKVALERSRRIEVRSAKEVGVMRLASIDQCDRRWLRPCL